MCARVSSICAIRKQVWWRFNCLNLVVLQNIEWPVVEKKENASICFRTAANAHVGDDFFVYCADWPFLSIFAKKGPVRKVQRACEKGAKKGSPDLGFWGWVAV